MAYHLYTLRGIVVRLDPAGEHSRRVALLTDELGLVYAHVQAGRGASSKLKMHIQPMTVGSFTVVRGKRGYRLTGAVADGETYYLLPTEECRVLVARVLALAERLLVADSGGSSLFTSVRELLSVLVSTQHTADELRALEAITVLKVLYVLGYVAEVPEFVGYLQMPLSANAPHSFVPHIPHAIRSINTALRASGL